MREGLVDGSTKTKVALGRLLESLRRRSPMVRGFEVGLTQVFYTHTAHRLLEKQLREVQNRKVVVVQKVNAARVGDVRDGGWCTSAGGA